MSMAELTTFFGWMCAINIGILLFSTFMIMGLKNWAARLHSKMFGLSEVEVRRFFYLYLAGFKIVVIVFSLTPWLALVAMG